MNSDLQKRHIPMVIKIIALLHVHRLSRIQWTRTLHQKLVALSAQFHG